MSTVNQTIGEEVSNNVRVPAGRTVTIAYSTTDLDDATFFLEITRNDGASWQVIASFAGTDGAVSGSVLVENRTNSDFYVRASAVEVAEGTFDGTVDIVYTFATKVLTVFRDSVTGVEIARLTTDGIEFSIPVVGISGDVVGNVTGNVTGSIAGGNVTVPIHADNTAALAAGLTAGMLYSTAAGVVATAVEA